MFINEKEPESVWVIKMIHDSDMSRHEKQKIRSRTTQFIKRHDLKIPCQICQNNKSVAHHQDYTKAYDINFLCEKHHWAVHNGEIKEPNTINIMILAEEKGFQFRENYKRNVCKNTDADTCGMTKLKKIIEPFSDTENKFMGMKRAVCDAEIIDSINHMRTNVKSDEIENRLCQIEEILEGIDKIPDKELTPLYLKLSDIYNANLMKSVMIND